MNMINKNKNSQPSASIIIIGNEILSGRTRDKNINFIAERCNAIGLFLKEVRVIQDKFEIIEDTVLDLAKKYDNVFTTGGIGPTHDDITAEAISRAFKVNLVLNKEARKRLERHYDKSNIKLNEARLRMARIPEGAELIDNPVSAAPGFRIRNVWVMAGVPIIVEGMFKEYIEKNIVNGAKSISKTITVKVPEGEIAKIMSKIQSSNEEVEIGSYPFYRPPNIGTSIVIRGLNETFIKKTIDLFITSFKEKSIEYEL